ncbi:MAG: hypothetical protein DME70_10995, partial [Verrucomicrobia bacterium]
TAAAERMSFLIMAVWAAFRVPAFVPQSRDYDGTSDRRGRKNYADSAYFRLTHITDAISWCPAEMRIPQTRDVLLFGLMGEPVSISQLIGSDFVLYRSRSNGDL